jgi:hypothetical protein
MTGSSAHDTRTRTTENTDSRRASRRKTRTRTSDTVPEGGKIDRTISSPIRIIMAVAVLVLVTVVSSMAVSV